MIALSGCQTSAKTGGFTSYDEHYQKNETTLKEDALSDRWESRGSKVAVVSKEKADNNDYPEAKEVLLVNNTKNKVIVSQKVFDQAYPASTTKIMTALLTLENLNLSQVVTIKHDITFPDGAAVAIHLKKGDKITVEALLNALIIMSANDAAVALGEAVAGSEANFVKMMNKRAKELGANNSHFANASGLYNPDHYTTAYDMAMIARGCYNNSTFVSIDSTPTSYTIGPTNLTGTNRTFKHRHQMLAGRPYYYEYCKGGKTGYTDESGCTLVTFAEKDNMRLICVCFKSGDNERFIDTRTLFDWGFDNFQKITVSGEAISSLFSNSNYYMSDVFGKYSLSSNLNASTLTIPLTSSAGDIKLKVADDSNITTDNNSFTTNINFTLSDNIVGSTTLTLSSDANNHADSKLPYLSNESNDKNLSQKKCISINIWIFIVIIAIIAVVIFTLVRRNVKQYRRSSSKRSLHF